MSASAQQRLALEFWAEFEQVFVWDFLPFNFLHDVYMAWLAEQQVSDGPGENPAPLSSRGLTMALAEQVSAESGIWECRELSRQSRPGTRMDAVEPLVQRYNLVRWQEPKVAGPYRGFTRQ